MHHLPSGPKTFLHKGRVVTVHDTEMNVKWGTDRNDTKVTALEVFDCDQATCTQPKKCRGGTEEVTHCLDAQTSNYAQRVNADRVTCIFLRVFGKWMTEADILELSG